MAKNQSVCIFAIALFGFTLRSKGVVGVDTTTLASLGKEVEDNSRYKTLEANATLLKLLVDDKDGVSRTEVFDMLHSRDDIQEHVDLPSFPEDSEDERLAVPDPPDSQAEFLQVETSISKDSYIRYRGARGEPFGVAAGIMVVITCTIVCLAYIALIVWRRIYLKRNGLKHELLRNEENIAETQIEL
ncbi:unnamed protein product [Chilo suppressalis]|uniref:Uncharacterized protein n=1 Tax=Chilo suppressalis TaxID=168631 RepID=A0ABN8EC06_CHISP|nr:hypothetical protein evm_013455 [Chilo suppressalis]CAH0693161.1 unnamed protein product [Chilo suppressalis]